MQAKLEQEYYLRAQDVDINGTWSPSSIFVRMQEVSEDHACEVGLGRVDIIDKFGICWVLTRVNLSMLSYPSIGETILVKTWPLKPKKMLFLRNYLFYDSKGQEIGRANIQWILFDVNKRRLMPTSSIGDYPYCVDEEPVVTPPNKIILPKDMEEKSVRTVLYSDVDMNGHMNNTKYLNWICELFPTDFLKTHKIKNIRINYIAEAYIDQTITLMYKQVGNDHYIYGQSDGKVVFDACLDWM